MSFLPEHVELIRKFNRDYTTRLGLMQKNLLDLHISLTEGRILFEIAAQSQVSAIQIRCQLGLDGGYVSRTLARLESRGFITQSRSDIDARERELELTELGRAKVVEINRQSDHQIGMMLTHLSVKDRESFVEAIATLSHLLGKIPPQPVLVTRINSVTPEAKRLIREYYEAIQVVVRDSSRALEALVNSPTGGIWIATMGQEAVGCVAMRDLPSIEGAAECKRLYVRPSARGYGIGNKLVTSMEDYARSIGIAAIYLDSHEGLQNAITLYESRGYQRCQQYNDNPQATVFMRKLL